MADFAANQHLYEDRNINHWEWTHELHGVSYYQRRKAYAQWVRLTQVVPEPHVPMKHWSESQKQMLLKINHLKAFIRIQHKDNPAVERMAWWLSPDYREQRSGPIAARRYSVARGRTPRSMPRRRLR